MVAITVKITLRTPWRAAIGITLAGGHSIDAPEPIFGLAVTGKVAIKHLKENSTAKVGDKIYLTKH
jgi:selenide,water dikinase